MGEYRIELEQCGQDRAQLDRLFEDLGPERPFSIFVKAFFAFFSQPFFGAAMRECAGLLAEHVAQFGNQGNPPLALVVIVDSVPTPARNHPLFQQSHLVIIGKRTLIIWR